MRAMRQFVLWQLGLSKAWTSRTPTECACLERYAAGKKRVVEIGCWYGVNTRRLRSVMAPGGVLFAVDPYPTGRLGFSTVAYIAAREVAKCPNGQVKWLRLTDTEAARQFIADGEKPIDFLFIDAVNSYEGLKRTWQAWSPLLAPRAIAVVGDSRASATRPIENLGSAVYTREVILKQPAFQLVETADTFSILEKQSGAETSCQCASVAAEMA